MKIPTNVTLTKMSADLGVKKFGEGRDMVTLENPGAYLHVYMPKDKRIVMKLRGDFVEIIRQVNPEFEHHVRYDNGKKCYVSISDQGDLWFNQVFIIVL